MTSRSSAPARSGYSWRSSSRLAGVKPLVLERLVEPDRTIKAAAVGAVGGRGAGATRARACARRRAAGPWRCEVEAGKARSGSGPMRNPAAISLECFSIDQSLQQRAGATHASRGAGGAREDPGRARERARARDPTRHRRWKAFEDEGDDGVAVTDERGPARREVARRLRRRPEPHPQARGLRVPGAAPAPSPAIRRSPSSITPRSSRRDGDRTPRGLVVVRRDTGPRFFTAEFDGPPPNRDAPITQAEVEASIRA